MQVKSIHIRNFRSIKNVTLEMEDLTVLVGANGTGKSSLLKAFEFFYTSSVKLDVDDFYAGDTSVDISIGITFHNFSERARELFASYVQHGALRVDRVFTWDGTKFTNKYHGQIHQAVEFAPVREAMLLKDRGRTAKEIYERLRANDARFSTLPSYTTADAVKEAMKSWETSNEQYCIRERDEGQFFGFQAVAQGYLGRFTRFLFIPAVRDAGDDASDGKGAVIATLMDLVVRSALARRGDLKDLREKTRQAYSAIMEPSNLHELQSLSASLTETLQTYVPQASLDLEWLSIGEVDLPLPRAHVRLVEDGYRCAVTRTGHGLQRAFILTALQHLAVAESRLEDRAAEASEGGQDLPSLLLAIEEPELYQHPNRQRHFAQILRRLAVGTIPGVASHTQVIYGTHSPLFVGLDRIEQIRLLRKNVPHDDEREPRVTEVSHTTLSQVADDLWEAQGRPSMRYSATTLQPRLHAIMTPWMNEGFFAEVTVLVEGEDDRAAVLGVAHAMGLDLDSQGIAVIPCGGKASIDRPALIFKRLGIPVYAIWDSDTSRPEGEDSAKHNHALLRICGCPGEAGPSFIGEACACFREDLEATLKSDVGKDVYERHLKYFMEEYGIPKKKHALKNPNVVSGIIIRAKGDGKRSPCIESIVEKILALRNSGRGMSRPESSG